MSKPGKISDAQKTEWEELPFEKAVQRLEAIVDAMETEEQPLETLLARFEEGTRLVRVCQAKLAEAELKIQRLEKDMAGEFKLKPVVPGDAE